MLPDTFATSGMEFTCNHQPTRFQVFGERSSGTNYVKRLIGRNTILKPSEALGWKHGFPHMAAIPADMAVILVVRGALDWSRSMHAKPWHTTPALQEMDFGRFIRAEWDTIIDRARYFQGETNLGILGQPLQHDRDPVTGRRFANLFALRRAKLAALTTFQARHGNCAIVRMEDVIGAPERFIRYLREGFELPAQDGPFRPIVKRLGSKFKPAVDGRPMTPLALDEDDLEFLKSQLDLDQERALGYFY